MGLWHIFALSTCSFFFGVNCLFFLLGRTLGVPGHFVVLFANYGGSLPPEYLLVDLAELCRGGGVETNIIFWCVLLRRNYYSAETISHLSV